MNIDLAAINSLIKIEKTTTTANLPRHGRPPKLTCCSQGAAGVARSSPLLTEGQYATRSVVDRANTEAEVYFSAAAKHTATVTMERF